MIFLVSLDRLANNDKKEFQDYEILSDQKNLLEVSKINILVGVNNSGKSRFLRKLFSGNELNAHFFSVKKPIPKDLSSELESIHNEWFNFFIDELSQHNIRINQQISRAYSYFPDRSQPSKDILSLLKSKYLKGELKFEMFMEYLLESSDLKDQSDFEVFARYSSLLKSSDLESTKDVEQLIVCFLAISKYMYEKKVINEKLHIIFSGKSFRIPRGVNKQIQEVLSHFLDSSPRIYISPLRGLRPINFRSKDFDTTDSYKLRTEKDYFGGSEKNIFSGLEMYEDVRKKLLGTQEDRLLISNFEGFLGKKVFADKVTIIPRHNEDVLYIKLGQDNEFPIYDLGDGIQAIITILYPVFTKQEKTIFFIEEPEIHLHPRWQALLLEALDSFKDRTYFITTHSAIFMNSELVKTFLVQKKNNSFEISEANINSKKLEILRNLGYKPSDLLQTNYILWVEGPSDRIYFNYWISKIASELKEEQHYSIMFYAGGNKKALLEDESGELDLSFIKSLNQNFGLVMDSDKKNKDDEVDKKKEEICSHLKKEKYFCWITNFREMENYIPFNDFITAIKQVHNDKQQIKIGNSYFDDRCTPVYNSGTQSYSPKIQLSNEFFSKIQKKDVDALKEISEQDLKNEIKNALNEKKNKKSTFKINKIKVAKAVVKNEPEIEEKELKDVLAELVKQIKQANDMSEEI